MKKLFIVLAIAAAFASCSDDKKTESSTEQTAPATTETAPATTETAPVATDAPTTTATTAH